VIQVGFLRGRAHRYRVLAFVAEGDLLWPPPSCAAKATVTTDSTVSIAIAATTLRIDTLRLIRNLLPRVGGPVLKLWLETSQARSSFRPLSNRSP
jgi:hypothetical protein